MVKNQNFGSERRCIKNIINSGEAQHVNPKIGAEIFTAVFIPAVILRLALRTRCASNQVVPIQLQLWHQPNKVKHWLGMTCSQTKLANTTQLVSTQSLTE